MSDPALPPAPRPPMRRATRVLVPVGAVALAFGGFAVAQAATDSGVDTPHDLAERGLDGANPPVDDDTPPATDAANTASATETTTNAAVDLPDGSTQTFTAGAAGAVTIGRSGVVLSVVAVGTNPGWTAVIEQASGPEVEVEFRNGTARVDLEAEFEEGAVRVRVRERTDVENDNDDNEVTPPSTPRTRVDNSGPGSVNRGPGSVDSGRDDAGDDDGPDHEVGDDSGSHSGSGSSGSGSSGSGSSGSGSGGSGSGHSGSDD